MLQAKSKTGVAITLAHLSKQEIDQLRSQSFYCPSCSASVIIKAGPRTIPHFAHLSKASCPSFEGGEGPYHEKGKLILYEWLRNQQLDVELEKYIPSIKQRPDLFLMLNNKRIAIEFQCAKIGIEQIRKRNIGYRKAGIIPIWILGAKLFQQLTRYKLRISPFLQQFIHQFNASFPFTLYFFCPDTNQFITVRDLYPTGKSHAIGKMNFSPITMLTLKDLFTQMILPNLQLYQIWKNEKQNFRLHYRNHLFGKELAWYQWLYMKQTHYEYLPSIVYLPVSTQFLMSTPQWNWQSRICIDILHPLPIGKRFTFSSCTFLLRNHLYKSQSFPLVQSVEHPISQYLQLLEKLDIIEQVSPQHYMKKNNVYFYNHVEEAIKGDYLLINRLISIFANKIEA